MLNQLLGDLPETLTQAQNSPTVVRMKRLLLITLALWMSYFLVVNWFVHCAEQDRRVRHPARDVPGRAGRRDHVRGHAVPLRARRVVAPRSAVTGLRNPRAWIIL